MILSRVRVLQYLGRSLAPRLVSQIMSIKVLKLKSRHLFLQRKRVRLSMLMAMIKEVVMWYLLPQVYIIMLLNLFRGHLKKLRVLHRQLILKQSWIHLWVHYRKPDQRCKDKIWYNFQEWKLRSPSKLSILNRLSNQLFYNNQAAKFQLRSFKCRKWLRPLYNSITSSIIKVHHLEVNTRALERQVRAPQFLLAQIVLLKMQWSIQTTCSKPQLASILKQLRRVWFRW
jgi:hypothetical protein